MQARRLLPRLAAAVLLALAPTFSARAQTDPTETARAAMLALDKATVALAEAEKSNDRISALTQTVQAYEEGLATLRDGLRRASLREASIQGALSAESNQLSQLLGVLQTIERAPEPALLVHPAGPIGTARSGMILSDVAPALQKEAESLRRDLEELKTLRALQENAVDTLKSGLEGAQDARFELSLAIARRTELPRRFVADDARMQTLVESADTLASFADGLMSEPVPRGNAAVTQDFTSVKGRLAMPALGKLIRRFNEVDAAGVRRPGYVIATRPMAIVTTPWPATVRYLGPLLDYGNVAIIEPGDGYLMVLAGLGQLYGEVGEVLPKGAPIGLMAGADNSGDQAFLIAAEEGTGADASETLYIELRENGTPVDPSDWFAAGKE
ncbi:peptidoglycan DD-metalloendopeptidase family protein [Aliiroseovarius sp. F47248L]|uniref:murein hydrolase activator EnvC family protein n=1 Tax=Aliiroseovarius sp. F47248L TaxID=2926420 RepID=UPI001FF1F34E|nr:peptidoglycan DD-metalloendopeptidase family protein [Aliiroseovarius sp. F47248L]MCK0139701.1 peptidoglycan DD-metalloendopeptidase family protein [Aliiroseovarius sp. F47248L]